ncbi:hypothetical protein ABB02_00069 [Clostridiaceae bacterium JG1575]|nr:hypothetical protein ABB02_00069 [Clostridiaceae bacterium JG1575]
MGFNYRKSISMGKGVRVNLSKSGPSVSFGLPGLRMSVNSRGRARGTASLPGTGVSYNKQINLFDAIAGLFGRGPSQKEGKPNGKAPAQRAAAKEAEKAAIRRASEEEVARWQAYLEHLRTVHHEADEPIDWQQVAEAQRGETKESQELKRLAEALLAGEDEALLQVVEKMQPFSDLTDVGSEFEVGITHEDLLAVRFRVNPEQVIPKTRLSVLASGALSEKPMSKTFAQELTRDYVLSTTFRVARDLFALLPSRLVCINAEVHAVNPATGHEEERTILSVLFPRESFLALNFQGIDLVAALKNFQHAMDYKATKGFSEVLPLK